MTNLNQKLKGNIILFITAIIWGISFVSQSVGMDYIGPNTFMGIRTTMGGLVLLPVIFFTDRAKKKNPDKRRPHIQKVKSVKAMRYDKHVSRKYRSVSSCAAYVYYCVCDKSANGGVKKRAAETAERKIICNELGR